MVPQTRTREKYGCSPLEKVLDYNVCLIPYWATASGMYLAIMRFSKTDDHSSGIAHKHPLAIYKPLLMPSQLPDNLNPQKSYLPAKLQVS